ncbi:hypothetical protein YSA_09472 [Pseudomonas putida ND6]|uniref:Uncharacterized protein n=1 Tax=Pseudomonas putida ND6 TaxID=231023 RepID=I3V2C5_PSEPU|nr:hypothetical protein YSA_09472 [Pseudomonas putida ND6]
MPQHKEVHLPLAPAKCNFCSVIDHFSPCKHGPCTVDRRPSTDPCPPYKEFTCKGSAPAPAWTCPPSAWAPGQ